MKAKKEKKKKKQVNTDTDQPKPNSGKETKSGDECCNNDSSDSEDLQTLKKRHKEMQKQGIDPSPKSDKNA